MTRPNQKKVLITFCGNSTIITVKSTSTQSKTNNLRSLVTFTTRWTWPNSWFMLKTLKFWNFKSLLLQNFYSSNLRHMKIKSIALSTKVLQKLSCYHFKQPSRKKILLKLKASSLLEFLIGKTSLPSWGVSVSLYHPKKYYFQKFKMQSHFQEWLSQSQRKEWSILGYQKC